MRIFVTGDTHGDFSRLMAGKAPALDRLTKDDFVIICGDFGGVWDGSLEEQKQLRALEQRPFTTLFVSGNHENYDLLAKFPVTQWNGGKVQRIRPSILHLLRGQIFTLGGRTFFTMGGASSHDVADGILEADDPLLRQKSRRMFLRGAQFRVNHRSWWKEELPSPAEYRAARRSLARRGWQADYFITHCAPTSIQDALTGHDYAPDALTDFFEELRKRCRFKRWFFGHYHSGAVTAAGFVLLYRELIEL